MRQDTALRPQSARRTYRGETTTVNGNAPDPAEGRDAAGQRRLSRAESLRLTRMPQRPVARTSDPAGPGAPPAVAAPARNASATPGRGESALLGRTTLAAPGRDDSGRLGPDAPAAPGRPAGGRKGVRRAVVGVTVAVVALAGAGWAYRMEIAEAGSEPAPPPVAEPVGSGVLPSALARPLTESAQGAPLPGGVSAAPPPGSAPAAPLAASAPAAGQVSRSPAGSAAASPSGPAGSGPAGTSSPAGKSNPSGANLALGGVASASAVEGDAWLPRNAIDGDETTRWSSGFSDPQWIKVDLRQRWRISEVTLVWEHAYGVAYRVETSVDGTKWKAVYSTTAGKGGEVAIDAKGETARYIRMYGTKRNGSYGYSLLELRVT
ncbi:discoidin domain-containing protein [Actinoplanes sp. NPDC023936]|uniref:discoidin domain-containing protein n=1 Tax=Actinoplanes sp. NPDC023936 TaxID=3154910 RepID=UPI003400D040